MRAPRKPKWPRLTVEKPPEPPAHEYASPPPRGKRLVWIVAAFAIGVALLLTVGGYFVWTQILHTENTRAKAAEADYNARKYDQAGDAFKSLPISSRTATSIPITR